MTVTVPLGVGSPGDLVARVVEEVHALEVGDVPVAVGEHHLERHAVDGGA